MSLVGALGPLGKVPGRQQDFVLHVAAYALSGAITSAVLGAGLGELGHQLGAPSEPLILIATAVTALVLARELGVPLPLPQLRRQTRSRWSANSYLSAVLWGADLGLVFTTYLTFAGAWVLLAWVITTGNPAVGAATFAAFWCGRALSVWLAPLGLSSASDVPWLVAALFREQARVRRTHALALATFAVAEGAFLLFRSPA